MSRVVCDALLFGVFVTLVFVSVSSSGCWTVC